jgi:hypothetical protein
VRDYHTHVYIFVVNKPENTLKYREVRIMKKKAIITVRLIPTPEAYEGKTNRDIEREILEEAPIIPYAASIEKVTVQDVEG